MAPHPRKGLLSEMVRVQGIISWSGVGPPLQHLHSAWHQLWELLRDRSSPGLRRGSESSMHSESNKNT